jgi:hypothetical protein
MTGFSIGDTISYYIQGYSGNHSQTLPIAAPETVYTFWFDPYTAITNADKQQKVMAFPNPASDIVFINGIENIGTNTHYEIFNIQGVKVEEGTFFGEASIKLPVTLSNGLYIIKIITTVKTNICKLYLHH